MMRATILAPFCVIVLAGCSDLFAPEIAAVVETDRERYHVEEPISVTVGNTGETTIVLPRCGERVSAALDHRHGAGWQEHIRIAGACPAVYTMAPLELAPGEQHRFTVVVRDPGVYRIRVFRTGEDASGGFASGAFEVREGS